MMLRERGSTDAIQEEGSGSSGEMGEIFAVAEDENVRRTSGLRQPVESVTGLAD